MSKDYPVSLFSLEGTLIGFVVEDGYKIKRLRLETAAGEVVIKLSKEARASVGAVLHPGDWIQVWGEKTAKRDGEEKLKAYRVQKRVAGEMLPMPTPQVPCAASKKPEATILVCQKSDCMKRGGKAVCRVLEQELEERNLGDRVQVRMVGCMKQCKAGPNIVVNKTRYSRIEATEVPEVLDRHFPPASEPANEPASERLQPASLR